MLSKIGILTSGGDCAGLNAVLYAAMQRSASYGVELWGVHQGIWGLLRRPLEICQLSPQSFYPGCVKQGGTFLGTTNRGNPFAFPQEDGSLQDLSDVFLEGFHQAGFQGLIGIGGDGSLEILRRLSCQGGFPLIGIPKTIDNDVGLTEHALGFSTAVDIATEALDRLQPTAASHDRIMLLEVMGRDAGHIALSAGIAGGADVILIPEIPYTLSGVVTKIKSLQQAGRNFALVIVAEAAQAPGVAHQDVGIGHFLAGELARRTGAEARCTVLGHVQRGAAPSAQDRLLAYAFGVHAVDLLLQGKADRMVAWQHRCVVDVSLAEAIASYQNVDINGPLVKTAKGLGIYIGE